MKRGWILALLGVAAFLVLLIATLPARVLLDRIPVATATGVGGSLWSGHAADLNVQGISLGRTEWRLFALPLFVGHLEVEARVSPPGGSGTAHCVITLKQDVKCSRVQASLPLETLRISSLPAGWSGLLVADLQQLQLHRGWPVALTGTVDVKDVAQNTNGSSSPFGSFQLEFPDAALSTPDKGLTGALHDTGGPLDVVGTLRLQPDRTYVIDGQVGTRANAPRNLVESLQYLGTPDAQGRREFSIAGSL